MNKELLTTIREKPFSEKCGLVIAAYSLLSSKLELLSGQVRDKGVNINFGQLELKLDQIEEVLLALEAKLYEVDVVTLIEAEKTGITPRLLKENPAEIRKLAEDYHESIKTLHFFNLLDKDNQTYTADYDGSEEEDGQGEDFFNKKFPVPTMREVFERLTSAQIKLYKKMKKAGLKPKLQLTPIGMSIGALAKKIDAKRPELKINTRNTYVWENINDSELIYEAENFQVIDSGKQLQISEGKSKTQWIKENDGWAINIVATKQNLEADSDKIQNTNGQTYTDAQKFEKCVKDYRQRGYRGLTYETYLIAQMEILQKRKALEKTSWTILPESSLKNPDYIAGGSWGDGRIGLMGCIAFPRNDSLRFRYSVSLKKLET